MIGSLLYLLASCPDIKFDASMCAYFQASLKESNLTAIKKHYEISLGTYQMDLWYLKGINYVLIGYPESNFVG